MKITILKMQFIPTKTFTIKSLYAKLQDRICLFTKAEFQRKLLLINSRNYLLIQLFFRIFPETTVKANTFSSGSCFKTLKICRVEIDSLNLFIVL